MSIELFNGDCRDKISSLSENSIDTIITDPPYEINLGAKFSKKWDNTGISFDADFWAECLRVVKPGGLLMSFGHPKKYHRLVCAIEDSGWQIRDSIMYLHGEGKPTGINIGKQLTNDDSWEGYNTGLKPAYEPIVIAQKPIVGTYAENAKSHGVGGYNINYCRIDTNDDLGRTNSLDNKGWLNSSGGPNEARQRQVAGLPQLGRWPANVILDGSDTINDIFNDAARFFYTAKPSQYERALGCKENSHMSVKPLSLMQYLCKLSKPPAGGIVLDPFMGSGTTGMACVLTGRSFIGCENDNEFFAIAQQRVSYVERRWQGDYRIFDERNEPIKAPLFEMGKFQS